MGGGGDLNLEQNIFNEHLPAIPIQNSNKSTTKR